MNVGRVLWRTWIVLTAIWVILLFLTGKYWCPLFFWESHLQCTISEAARQLVSLLGMPLIILTVGWIIVRIIAALRSKISN
jgi:hypothetical protein